MISMVPGGDRNPVEVPVNNGKVGGEMPEKKRRRGGGGHFTFLIQCYIYRR